MIWMSLALAAPVCSESTTNDAVAARLAEAQAAYASLEEDVFRVAMLDTSALIQCLDKPIAAKHAAAFHRLSGLEAFSIRDIELAEQSFAAARAADGKYSFPKSLVPQESPIRSHYKALPLASLTPTAFDKPESGAIVIDGQESRTRRYQVPSVFQRVDENGVVVQSGLVVTGAELPAYPVLQKRGFRVSAPIAVAGGALVAGSLGMFLASRNVQESARARIKRDARESYERPRRVGELPQEREYVFMTKEQLESRAKTSNTLQNSALGVGIGGVALIGVSLIVRNI